MAWKPTPKPTLTWNNPTSKRPPASTSAGGPTGAASVGPLTHPPARPPALLPRHHPAPPRGIVPGSSSWTRRLAHRSEHITWDAPPRDIVRWVCFPALSLRTRRSGHAARATPSRKLLLTVPLRKRRFEHAASVAPSICWQESDVSVSAGPFSSLDGKKSSFLHGETLSSDAEIPISCQFGV